MNHDLYVKLLAKINPIIDAEHKIALLWNAKAGCTFAVKWMFYQIGLLEKAVAFNSWIHEYREKVYSRTQNYQESLKSCVSPEYTFIKLVRDPYSRAVSSYIHALKYKYENRRISAFLSKEVNDDRGFSYREFIDYLMETGVKNCDIHHRRQTSELEDAGSIKVKHIIKLENSIPEFRKLEELYNLQPAPLDDFRESFHNLKKIEGDEFCGDREFKAGEESFFNYKLFYDKELIEKVKKLYKEDFEYYDYSYSLNR